MSRRLAAAGIAGLALVSAVVVAEVRPNRPSRPSEVGLPAIAPDGTRTFAVAPGDDVRFAPGVARPGDVVVCEGFGVVAVGTFGTEVRDPAGLAASTDPGGGVTVTCEPGGA